MDDHDHGTATLREPPKHLDYSLVGENATRAIERGLAEADWYQTPVPRDQMRALLERRDGPAIRDTLLWFALILGSGALTIWLWPSPWSILPYLVYAVLYASSSDSRWHEAGHGTAFKTDWMNNALYEIASFMVMREPDIWRWSHTRHHSDTIIVGRDPEIAVPRPPNIGKVIGGFFNIKVYQAYFRQLWNHSLGRMLPEEKTFVPETEYPKIYRKARIHLSVYVASVVLSILLGSILPLLFVGLANLVGSWLMVVYGLTQHAGLAENVLDHRLNCRTVHMNGLHRYLYWNMNYHVEHHMFPLVPYHALPRLHELVKHDMPTPYGSIAEAYREIVPTILRQVKDPAYHAKRKLPDPPEFRKANEWKTADAEADDEGWIEVCAAADLGKEDVIRFDHERKTFALMRDSDASLHATDGICTHGNTHLGDGLVKDGIIECPKHNGRFRLADGSPARPPVCRGLATYPLEERDGRLFLNILQPGGAGAREPETYTLKLVSTRTVATFIRELEFKIAAGSARPAFQPGDYLQFDIPAYGEIRFRDFEVPEPYRAVWERQHVLDLVARKTEEDGRRNNYSLASDPEAEEVLRINVRIATPPPGQDCPPGVGSSWMWSLKPGDTVTAIGPSGDFHIKPTQREMVYIGGGSGMAPLRSHLSHLLESQGSARKISFWYGARSRQELFYDDLFERLAEEHANFSFHTALSDPLDEDDWNGPTGFIHEVVRDDFLKDHPSLQAVEFYLCGPPMMIRACTRMLADFGVPDNQIAFDEF